MHDTSLFKQPFSFLCLRITGRSCLGFFSFSDFFRFQGSRTSASIRSCCPVHLSVHRMECVHLHKYLYGSSTAAAVSEPSGFHREAGMFLSGFPQDSIMTLSGFTRITHEFFRRFRELRNCTKKVCLMGILTNRNKIWRFFGSKKICVR